jgi:hypothetical protein
MLVEESETARIAEPCWSADSNLLYYLSERDGWGCVWARRLDQVTGRLVGESYPVLHAHTARHMLWAVGAGTGPQRHARPAVPADGRSRANVWTAKLPR